MTHAKRKFSRDRQLSIAETALLAREVLENARQALHNSQARAGHAPVIAAPRRAWSDYISGEAAQVPRFSAKTRPWASLALVHRIGDSFECLTIVACLIFSAAGWIITRQ